MADVAWRGMRGELDDEHESSNRYEFLRLNAAAPLPFQSRDAVDPASKLFGMQLGHFAGFVRRSWRANDFMWGRLDGAARLVDLLIAPRRLRLSPVKYQTLAAIPGLHGPIPPKKKDYLDPDDPEEIGAWRACLQNTLAVSIIQAELDGIAAAMKIDVDTRKFADDPDLAATLAAGDADVRFTRYAKSLGGGDKAAPERTIKQRVLDEGDSPGGKKLKEHAVDVVGTVLKGQGGALEITGRAVHLVGIRGIERILFLEKAVNKEKTALKRTWKAVRARIGF
jgi:hypothetical protein